MKFPKVIIDHKEHYKCNICKLVFTSEEQIYEYHLKVVNHPTCAICHRPFKLKATLTYHVRNVHYKYMCASEKAEAVKQTGVPEIERKNIKCLQAQCEGKTFTYLNDLREHMSLLHGEDHSFTTLI